MNTLASPPYMQPKKYTLGKQSLINYDNLGNLHYTIPLVKIYIVGLAHITSKSKHRSQFSKSNSNMHELD